MPEVLNKLRQIGPMSGTRCHNALVGELEAWGKEKNPEAVEKAAAFIALARGVSFFILVKFFALAGFVYNTMAALAYASNVQPDSLLGRAFDITNDPNERHKKMSLHLAALGTDALTFFVPWPFRLIVACVFIFIPEKTNQALDWVNRNTGKLVARVIPGGPAQIIASPFVAPPGGPAVY